MKTIFKTILGTIQGLNQEGSSKRITAMYFTVILLSSLVAMYEYGLYIAVNSLAPTTIHTAIIQMYTVVNYSLLVTIWLLLGLATLETIINLIKTIKGNSTRKNEEANQN